MKSAKSTNATIKQQNAIKALGKQIISQDLWSQASGNEIRIHVQVGMENDLRKQYSVEALLTYNAHAHPRKFNFQCTAARVDVSSL